jgi:hypothetical protein
MRLNELRDTSYEIAKSKGWHDPEFDTATFADRMALVISELAEALESHRVDADLLYFTGVASAAVPETHAARLEMAERGAKPEGTLIELIDALIRIGDCAGRHEIDLEAEDGNPLLVERLPVPTDNGPPVPTFGSWMCAVSHSLALAAMYPDDAPSGQRFFLVSATRQIGYMLHWLGISGDEVVRAIEIKHAYNRTRSFRHGGKKL